MSSLAVISRNSAFVFKGRHVDVPKVARELNVTHVLEGSVRKAGGRVRITAQLVEAASNDHLWAERYDRELQDIFALQDEISAAIVKALRLRLQPGEKRAIEQRGTDSVEAYNLYLMARQLFLTGNEGDVRRSNAVVRLSTRATELDPGRTRVPGAPGGRRAAWPLCGGHEQRRRHGGRRARPCTRRRTGGGTRGQGDDLCRRRPECGGLARDGEALRLDPDSPEVNRAAGYLSYREHRLGDAIRFWEKAAALTETDINSLGMLLSCYRAVGDVGALQRVARLMLVSRTDKVLAHDPNNGTVLGYSTYALAALGERERTKERMDRALLVDPDNLNMRYNFACALVIHLPDHEAALDLLGPFFEKTAQGFLNHALVDPDFEAIRDHPRFKAMVQRAEERLAKQSTNTRT